MLRHALTAVLAAAAAPLLWAAPTASAAAEPAVTISIPAIEHAEGAMMIAVFDEAGWDGDTPAAAARVGVASDALTVTIALPGPGRYGVKLFHDRNGDGRLALGPMGIPAEPYGFSNDAPVQGGPPRFADAAFDVADAPATQTVTLR